MVIGLSGVQYINYNSREKKNRQLMKEIAFKDCQRRRKLLVIETKVVISWFKLQPECDWLIELSNNKLSGDNLASELPENRSCFKPTTVEEIVICMINIKSWFVSEYISKTLTVNLKVFHVCFKNLTKTDHCQMNLLDWW